MIVSVHTLLDYTQASEESTDLLGVWINVNIEEARSSGKARHGANGPHQGIYEPCTHTGSDITNRYDEPSGSTLESGVVRQREVGLGHTHGEVSKAQRLVAIQLHLSCFGYFDVVCSVDL